MHPKLQRISDNLSKLVAFTDSLSFPEGTENLFSFNANSESADLTCYINHAPNEDGQQRLLALCGDLFGRDGWKARFDQYSNHYNWRKEKAGVRLHLQGAQKSTMIEEFPVPSTNFPLTLVDREPEPVEPDRKSVV